MRCTVVALALSTLLAGCQGGERTVENGEPDLGAARAFDRHPLYWVGKRFEKWELERVDVTNTSFTTFSYGTCEIEDPDGSFGVEGGSCQVPLRIQIQRLCSHLGVVARAPIWRRRQVRGAPVGAVDSAPVLFTNRVQVKVYRGRGSDSGLPMRVLRALRSVNAVRPILDPGDPIPPAPLGVLEGTERCRD